MLEVIKITKEIAWMFLLNIFIVYVSSMIKTNFMLIIKKITYQMIQNRFNGEYFLNLR